MAEQDAPPRVDPYQVAEIVGSYVRHHQIEPDELIGLIVEVHRALASLGRASAVQASAKPAVPIRRSVQQDYYQSFASSAGFARKCFAAICGSRTVSMSPLTAPVGDCRRIIQ